MVVEPRSPNFHEREEVRAEKVAPVQTRQGLQTAQDPEGESEESGGKGGALRPAVPRPCYPWRSEQNLSSGQQPASLHTGHRQV